MICFNEYLETKTAYCIFWHWFVIFVIYILFQEFCSEYIITLTYILVSDWSINISYHVPLVENTDQHQFYLTMSTIDYTFCCYRRSSSKYIVELEIQLLNAQMLLFSKINVMLFIESELKTRYWPFVVENGTLLLFLIESLI